MSGKANGPDDINNPTEFPIKPNGNPFAKAEQSALCCCCECHLCSSRKSINSTEALHVLFSPCAFCVCEAVAVYFFPPFGFDLCGTVPEERETTQERICSICCRETVYAPPRCWPCSFVSFTCLWLNCWICKSSRVSHPFYCRLSKHLVI